METSNQRLLHNNFSKVFLTLFSLFLSVIVFAQDATKKIDVDINTNSGGFFGSPWIWVVGIAVFVLLLVALLRGNGRRSA
ncbi:MAG: hypothetical protein JWQ40_2097 [Segetibacter sp.]|jgi:hypothetical protein|nr:hypothetical protein [Segetibacter sp.]